MGIKFEIKNGEYIYTDKETGAKVDFFGAWALVLKRFDKKDDGPRTVAISRISEKLEEMRLDGKLFRWKLRGIKKVGKRDGHVETLQRRNGKQADAKGCARLCQLIHSYRRRIIRNQEE